MAEAGGQPAESAELVASRAGAVLGFAAKLKENAAQSFKEVRTAAPNAEACLKETGRSERSVAAPPKSTPKWLRRTPFAPPAHAAFLCLCRPSHGRRCLIAPPSASLQAWLRCVLLQSTLRQGSCGLLPARSLAVAAVEKGPAMSAVTPVAPSQCLMPSTKGNIALSAPPRLQSKRTLGCLAPCYATPPLVSPRSPAQATLRRCKGVSHFPTLLFLATPRSCRAYRGHAKPGLG